jgi:fibronectin-binding autotransporter adhesin
LLGRALVTIPDGSRFTLSVLLFNTNAANVGWILSGETNTLVAPAEVRVDANVAGLYSVLAGSAGLTKSGNSVLELRATNNLFSGSVTVTGGLVRARSDGSLGPVRGRLGRTRLFWTRAGLANFVENPSRVNASRGITIGPKHGWLLARSSTDTEIEAPITGERKGLHFAEQRPSWVFSNPSNDYSGDTVVGADSVGSWTDASALAVLAAGCGRSHSHGAGKGRLFFRRVRRGGAGCERGGRRR